MAIGGGTLQGLSRLLLKTHDFRQIAAIAEKGDITRVNLQIGDICNRPLPDLPVHATASLFGKANGPIKDFVLIGNLTKFPQCQEVFPNMEKIYGVHFHIPPYAEYRTAIGAALAYLSKH